MLHLVLIEALNYKPNHRIQSTVSENEVTDVRHFSWRWSSVYNDTSETAMELIMFQSSIFPGSETYFIQSKYWVNVKIFKMWWTCSTVCLQFFSYQFFKFPFCTDKKKAYCFALFIIQKYLFNHKFSSFKFCSKFPENQIESNRVTSIVKSIKLWPECILTSLFVHSHLLATFAYHMGKGKG